MPAPSMRGRAVRPIPRARSNKKFARGSPCDIQRIIEPRRRSSSALKGRATQPAGLGHCRIRVEKRLQAVAAKTEFGAEMHLQAPPEDTTAGRSRLTRKSARRMSASSIRDPPSGQAQHSALGRSLRDVLIPSIRASPWATVSPSSKAYVFPLGPRNPNAPAMTPRMLVAGHGSSRSARIATPRLGEQDDRLRQDMAEVGWIDFAELRRQ